MRIMTIDLRGLDLISVFQDVELCAEPIENEIRELIESLGNFEGTSSSSSLISDVLSRVKHLIENFVKRVSTKKSNIFDEKIR